MSPYPTITGFEFTALIGRGGMATIYAARQLGLNRDVAIKVVEVNGADAAQYMQRLENEAQSLAQLRHPGIVGLYQYGRTNEGAMYYVMPLLDGGDLSQRKRPLAEDAVVALLDQLLDALQHAHRAGIVHRDIKPENILFDTEQRPLLADFGAAQRATPSRLTEAGMAIGSAGYMSPEQARGRLVDARSDLYSVGVLAFELLVGRLPFEGPDALSIALAQVEQQPAPLPDHLSHWQRYFERALALDPQQRFDSAAQMRSALGELHTRQSPSAPSEPASTKSTRATDGISRWRAIAMIALALIIAGAGLLAWLRDDESERLAQIAAFIDAGQLVQPEGANALALLADFEERDDEPIVALRQRLISAAWAPLQAPLASGDWVGLAPQLRRWQRIVETLQGGSEAAVIAQRKNLVETLGPAMQQALARFDRNAAEALLMLLDDLQPVPVELAELLTRLRQLPAVGGQFSDANGPPLVLLRAPGQRDPGLAMMNAALDESLYERYAVNTGRSVRQCDDAPPGARGCISLEEGEALARWLSTQTGHGYRLPELDELRAYATHIATSTAHAWSDTCQEVTVTTKPNAAKRAWGGIKKVFGGQGAQPIVRRHCQGHWLMHLDGSAESVARSAAAADTSLVLMRDIAPTDALQ